MTEFEERLDKFETKLDDIHKTLSKMAIQGEQISNLRTQQETLWRKYDKVSEDLAVVRNWQASCPRESIKEKFNWIWVFLVPMGVSLIGIGVHLITQAGKV